VIRDEVPVWVVGHQTFCRRSHVVGDLALANILDLRVVAVPLRWAELMTCFCCGLHLHVGRPEELGNW
jgi:hypothetical protein